METKESGTGEILSMIRAKLLPRAVKDSIFCHVLENNCGMCCKYIWHPVKMRFECSYCASIFFQSSPRMIFIFFQHSGIVLRVDHTSYLKMFPRQWLTEHSIFLKYYDHVSKIKSGSFFIVSDLEPDMFEIIVNNGTKNLRTLLEKAI